MAPRPGASAWSTMRCRRKKCCRSRALAQELADGPTWAIRWSKLSVNKWLKQQANLILDASLAYEMMTFKTEDHKEAVSAFVEKRKPNFVRSSDE